MRSTPRLRRLSNDAFPLGRGTVRVLEKTYPLKPPVSTPLLLKGRSGMCHVWKFLLPDALALMNTDWR